MFSLDVKEDKCLKTKVLVSMKNASVRKESLYGKRLC